jgi:Family of unknown function (DUF5989)
MLSRKKYWLWPVFVMLALLGVLIVLAQGSAVSAFIYTLICHQAACVPGSQPRPGSIIARSTAHRPETRRNGAHSAARTRRNFLSFHLTISISRENPRCASPS